MARAQKKLIDQVALLRGKLDKMLLCMIDALDEGDGLDWRSEQPKG